MTRRFLPATCAAALIMVLAAPGQAQPQYQQYGGPPFPERLHSDLQLTPSQEDGWKAFEQSYQPDPQEMARARDASSRMHGLTGPQRMDMAIGMAESNLAGMRHRGDVLKSFYATLSPQQQKIFDRDTLPPQ